MLSEPVATKRWLASYDSPFASIVIVPSSARPRMNASAATITTPASVSFIRIPAVNFFTTFVLRLMILERSNEGFSAFTAYLEACLIESYILAEYSKVFVGTQPSFKQTPPKAFFSKSTVDKPP